MLRDRLFPVCAMCEAVSVLCDWRPGVIAGFVAMVLVLALLPSQ